MKKTLTLFMCLIFVFSACVKATGTLPSRTNTPGITPPVSQTLPSPVVNVTQAPSAVDTADSFLRAWQGSAYNDMYLLLNGPSKDACPADNFVKIYQEAAYDLTLQSLDYTILSSLTYPTSAQVAYHVKFTTNLLGSIERDMQMDLSLENGQWKVLWEEGLILTGTERRKSSQTGHQVSVRGRTSMTARDN